jgi:hypothetical protein
MKYAVEMDSVAMIYKPSFIEIVPAVRKFKEGVIQRHTDRL